LQQNKSAVNFKKLYTRVCCVMQWSIGFSEGDIVQIIREKKCELSFNWIPLNDNLLSIADPFIFKDVDGSLNVLYEEFSVIDVLQYGKIKLAKIGKDFKFISDKLILDTKSHSSYPFIFVENEVMYIIPETSSQNRVSVYEYDFANKSLVNEKVLIPNMPLLDSTVFKYNGLYWLFATYNENEYNYSSLLIYYSDTLLGNYHPHANNPVKNSKDGSRPAGNVIAVDGEIYRPAQNCSQHYGESICINKITKLSQTEFEEEFYIKISPDKNSKYNSGVHTINFIDNIIVIDGIKMLFRPLTKWNLFFKRKFKKTHLSN
jgi:hypothetical protein